MDQFPTTEHAVNFILSMTVDVHDEHIKATDRLDCRLDVTLRQMHQLRVTLDNYWAFRVWRQGVRVKLKEVLRTTT